MNSICFIRGSRCSIVFIISPKIYRSKVSRSHYSLSGKCPVDCYALYLVPLQKVTCEVQNTEGMKQMTWQLTCVTSCLGWLTPPSLHTASAQQRRVESREYSLQMLVSASRFLSPHGTCCQQHCPDLDGGSCSRILSSSNAKFYFQNLLRSDVCTSMHK